METIHSNYFRYIKNIWVRNAKTRRKGRSEPVPRGTMKYNNLFGFPYNIQTLPQECKTVAHRLKDQASRRAKTISVETTMTAEVTIWAYGNQL
jgi:hypothetical protein